MNEEKNVEYRWSTKKNMDLYANEKYKIQFRISGEDPSANKGVKRFVIKYVKAYRIVKNSFGDKRWEEVC